MDRLTIALDVMGGDHGPKVVVPAALNYLRATQNVALILVGKEGEIAKLIPAGGLGERLSIRHASQEVAMNELPSKALRLKKDSSMRVAIDLVKSGDANACVFGDNCLMKPVWCDAQKELVDRLSRTNFAQFTDTDPGAN